MGSWIKKLAACACIVLWKKPFHNMCASCATELQDIFPSKVCAGWLGHTEQIANTHYRQVTETHFAKATENNSIGIRVENVNPLNHCVAQKNALQNR